MTWIAILTIGVGFLFAFINGMHDGSNVTATIIASRSFDAKKALALACIAEFFGAICLGTAVAKTVGVGVISQEEMMAADAEKGVTFILAALLGGILWNILTWILALPSSSSHAVIGGLIGSGIMAFGWDAVLWESVLIKVILFMLLSPLIGFTIGLGVYLLFHWFFTGRKREVESVIVRLQRATMAVLAFAYGSNDAQKSMGLIAMVVAMVYGKSEFDVDFWMMAGCAGALALGAICGGFNMIKTIGMKIYKLEPAHSFSCQISTIFVLLTATILGAPISTTQLITATVMGVGSGANVRRVNWSIISKIIISWFTTIPAAGAIGALVFWGLRALLA